MRGLVLLLCLFMLVPHVSLARTWHIAPDGTGDAPTIQAGIDSAATGDTVVLASGTYTGPGNRDVSSRGKTITIRSETRDPADCIVDCEGAGRGFVIEGGSGPSPRLEGVTITNGHDWQGGAVYVEGFADPILRDCAFISNSAAGYAGAVYAESWFEPARITGCTFIGNTSPWGGAFYCFNLGAYDLVADSCLFLENSAEVGGAIAHFNGHVIGEFRHCTFQGNSAVDGGALGIGPGSALFSHCTFYANTAESGGAASFGGGGAFFEGCTFVANSAETGSTIRCGYDGGPTLSNCIIAYGIGGAAFDVDSTGLYTPVLLCCDIYGNSGGDWVGWISRWYGISGNFSACPSFCNAHSEPYDFHLCDESPCLPGNHPDGESCGLIGAWDQGCACGPTRTEPTTWGRIKATFR